MKKYLLLSFIPLFILGTFLVPPAVTAGNITVTIPVAAFHPASNFNFLIDSGRIYGSGEPYNYSFVTPVSLPNGVTIKRATFFWKDTSSQTGYANLFRTNNLGTTSYITTPGTLVTQGSDGVISSSSIDLNVVFDSSFGYYMSVDGFTPEMELYGASIEYSYTTFLSSILK